MQTEVVLVLLLDFLQQIIHSSVIIRIFYSMPKAYLLLALPQLLTPQLAKFQYLAEN